MNDVDRQPTRPTFFVRSQRQNRNLLYRNVRALRGDSVLSLYSLHYLI